MKFLKLNTKSLFKYGSLVFIVSFLQILFLFLYHFFLEEILFAMFVNNREYIDKIYYTKIFSNLELVVTISILFTFVLGLSHHKICNYFQKLEIGKHFLFIALIVNFIAQILLILLINNVPIADSKYYIAQADNILKYGSYISADGFPTSFWPVGLPVILAVFKMLPFPSFILVKIFNVFFYSLYVIILFKIFEDELTYNQKKIFLLAFLLFPNNFFSVNVIMPDYLFSCLLWLVVYILLKKGSSINWYITIGLIIGVMSYIRPVGLAIPIILFAYLIKKNDYRIGTKYIIYVAIPMIILLLPWVYRNYTIFNSFVPVSTNGGYNFLMGNHEGSNGNVNFEFDYDQNKHDEAAESNKAYERAFADLVNNPFQSILRIPKKIFFSYWRGDSSITWTLKKTQNEVPSFLISFIFYWANLCFYIVMMISLFYFLFSRNKYNDNLLKTLFTLIYVCFLVIIVIYVGNERYIIPLMPIHFYALSKINSIDNF